MIVMKGMVNRYFRQGFESPQVHLLSSDNYLYISVSSIVGKRSGVATLCKVGSIPT